MKASWKLLSVTVAAMAAALAACAPASDPEDRTFDLRIVDGALAEPGNLSVKQGDNVTIDWTSDAPALVHLHGYDIEVQVTPERPGRMAFDAHATGGFDITLHPLSGADDGGGHGHGDHADQPGDACSEPLPKGVSPTLSVEARPSVDPMSFDVSVEIEDPPPGPLHWHLYVDGGLRTMTSQPTARLDLDGPGMYEVRAVLSSDATHCEYDVSATTMVTAGGQGMDMSAGHGGGETGGGGGDEEVTLTRLIVNP